MWSNSWIPKVLPPSEDHGYQSGQVGGSVMLWWIPSLGMSVCAISHECRLHIWQGMVCPKWHLNCQENPSLKWPWQSPKDLALVQIWAHPELMDSFIPRPSFQTFSLRPHPKNGSKANTCTKWSAEVSGLMVSGDVTEGVQWSGVPRSVWNICK